MNRSYSAKIKLKTMFGHRFHSLLKLHVGQRGVPYKLTVNSDRLWENRKPTDKSNISTVQVLIENLLVWSDAATRNGSIIAVNAGISLAFLATSASLVRSVKYCTLNCVHLVLLNIMSLIHLKSWSQIFNPKSS